MPTTYHVLLTATHNDLVRRAYLHRGYTADEANDDITALQSYEIQFR